MEIKHVDIIIPILPKPTKQLLEQTIINSSGRITNTAPAGDGEKVAWAVDVLNGDIKGLRAQISQALPDLSFEIQKYN